jgi:sigma-E factor negative regulatory protein RseB
LKQAVSWLTGLAILLQSGITWAEPDDWLARMSQAVRMRNYEGTLVYAQGGRMESMRIVHRYQDGHEQERLTALSGDAREILRDNDVVTCILPKDRTVKVERRPFGGLLPTLNRASVKDVSEYYELRELGSENIVGRACRVVAMVPRDGYRFGYRMWIDQETDVPLKVELLDRKGQALEQLMFTQISYPDSIEDSALKSAIDAKNFAWIKQRNPTTALAPGLENWIAGKLPPGFRMVVHEQQLMPGMQEPVEHMVFTDGLATVSAFVAPRTAPHKFKGISRMGAITAFARTVDDFHVTVMGEVPQATVELVANQLRYEAPEAAVQATPAAAAAGD